LQHLIGQGIDLTPNPNIAARWMDMDAFGVRVRIRSNYYFGCTAELEFAEAFGLGLFEFRLEPSFEPTVPELVPVAPMASKTDMPCGPIVIRTGLPSGDFP
jgi:hypothetical protein